MSLGKGYSHTARNRVQYADLLLARLEIVYRLLLCGIAHSAPYVTRFVTKGINELIHSLVELRYYYHALIRIDECLCQILRRLYLYFRQNPSPCHSKSHICVLIFHIGKPLLDVLVFLRYFFKRDELSLLLKVRKHV